MALSYGSVRDVLSGRTWGHITGRKLLRAEDVTR
jgi:hypothetical protein